MGWAPMLRVRAMDNAENAADLGWRRHRLIGTFCTVSAPSAFATIARQPRETAARVHKIRNMRAVRSEGNCIDDAEDETAVGDAPPVHRNLH